MITKVLPRRGATYAYICLAFVVFILGLYIGTIFRDAASTNIGSQSALDRIKTTREINVGYIIFPPTVTKNLNTGQLAGHFVATMQEIATQAGWKVNFVETDWAGFPAALSSKRIDVSIAPTFVTIPRALTVAFTRPLFYAGNSAIVRADDTRFGDIYSFDKPGVSISVIQGEASQEFVKTHFTHATIHVLPGPEQALAFQDVISGRADAAFGDEFAVAKFAKQYPEKVRNHFEDRPYNLTPVSWAVGIGDRDLLSFFNAAIEVLDTQGQLEVFEKEAAASWLHRVEKYSRQ
jgi:ABC-type amino acid transport substrate-binding protein